MTMIMQRGSIVVVALILAIPAVAGPDANAIMKQAQSHMTGMTSYQATWKVSIGMGQMGSSTMNWDMKMIPATGKVALKVSQVGAPSGMMAMTAGMFKDMQVVDDGKNQYVYSPMRGGYQKGPHKPFAMDPRKQFMDQAKFATFRYLRQQKMNGRDMHVIEMTVDMKKAAGSRLKNMPANQMQVLNTTPPAKGEVFVDVATNHIKQTNMHVDLGAAFGAMGGARPGAAGAKPPSIVMDTSMVIEREVLNAPIPDSVFKFTPPPGARLLPGIPGGPMGGMGIPGMGGGTGGRRR